MIRDTSAQDQVPSQAQPPKWRRWLWPAIIAVLVFGGLWGFWGVFFAIPLATLVKAVLNAWPKRDETPRPTP